MKAIIGLTTALLLTFGLQNPAQMWAQTPKTETPKAPATTKSDTAAKPPAKKGGKVDLNSASTDELKAAGLTDEQAKKVIDGRPWKRKDELVNRNILTKAEYDKVKDGVIAHQVKESTAAQKKK
jgi:competence protein ComEA